MRYQFSIYALLLICVFASCSPKIKKDLLNKSNISVYNINQVKVLAQDQNIPLRSNYIGKIKVGDSGLTVNCGYDEMINICKKEAQLLGANIVKLTKVKEPDFYSSCYRIEAKLYWNNTKEYAQGRPIILEYSELEKSILKLLQALRQGEFVFMDAEGYTITLYESSKLFNEKAIESLKKKFDVDKGQPGKRNPKIKSENIEFVTVEKQEGIELSRISLLFKNSEETVSFLELTTSLPRLMSFEDALVNLITENKIPNRVYTSWEVDSIQFANRHIKLGPACRWMGIRNIQCPGLGQMDWSEFSTKERAEAYINQRINVTDKKRLSEYEDQSKVPVIFEGTRIMAEKYNLNIKAPKFLLEGSNNLIIYYVAAPVEDEYIGCVLSHYDNDQNASGLPPLLSEVMKLNHQ
jgi:hypothetical protein